MENRRPAAVKVSVIAENNDCRFGFHSLAILLIRTKTDPKTMQAIRLFPIYSESTVSFRQACVIQSSELRVQKQ